jgi:hypothetical protein
MIRRQTADLLNDKFLTICKEKRDLSQTIDFMDHIAYNYHDFVINNWHILSVIK